MRQLSEYMARARQMPPQVLAKKVAQMAVRKTRRSLSKTWYQSRGSFTELPLRMSGANISPPTRAWLDAEWPHLEKALSHTMNHEFDLLGSGWVKVEYGMKVKGVLGSKYPTNEKNWSRQQVLDGKLVNSSNQKKSQEILSRITEDYQLIDWQLDFKSGYRWDNDQWWESVPYGHKPRVDIKVPWELSRMQHLPWLALGWQKTKDPKYVTEFKNQVLDFMANNPPRFGVNWKCPMDVAIRAANWVTSYQLFKALEVDFDNEFENWLANSLYDHGLFVQQNFEKGTDFRGNHYLADIAGLTFVAWAISGTTRINLWRDLCKSELLEEARYQFHKIGTNFEGSTAYHRLSSEMLYFPLFFVYLQNGEDDFFERKENLLNQLVGMSEFAKNITRPDQEIVQIGDNDSGRFFKLSPAWEQMNSDIVENHLDLSHLSATVESFFGIEPTSIESSIVHESIKNSSRDFLSGLNNRIDHHKSEITTPLSNPMEVNLEEASQSKTYRFDLAGVAKKDIKSYFYKDFGLCLFRGPELFVSFRCGPVGQLGRGGHDHNDQLSLEVFFKGQSLIRDPGTFLYTAAPEERNRYRSNKAHFCPQYENREMGDIEKALFFINEAAPGTLLSADETSAIGRCDGFGSPVVRKIEILEGELVVNDFFFSKEPVVRLDNFTTPPFSQAYGIRYN